MKKTTKIILILIIILIVIAIVGVGYKLSQPKLQECPDVIAGNVMPGSGGEAYYLKGGETRKISDYDEEWVRANCKMVEDRRVW